jgi:hypothetical protein
MPCFVADLGPELHLSGNHRSLCHLHVDERDLYELEAGWRVWEDRAGDRCALCARALERLGGAA